MAVNRSTRQVVQLWTLVILVKLLFIPKIVTLNLIIFSMCHKPQRILFLFILLQIIISFLNFTLGSFLLRTVQNEEASS
jgi:hypothetical protein